MSKEVIGKYDMWYGVVCKDVMSFSMSVIFSLGRCRDTMSCLVITAILGGVVKKINLKSFYGTPNPFFYLFPLSLSALCDGFCNRKTVAFKERKFRFFLPVCVYCFFFSSLLSHIQFVPKRIAAICGSDQL